jgi:hypothetical protein
MSITLAGSVCSTSALKQQYCYSHSGFACVQGTVQLEELSDDIALGDSVPARRRVRDPFEDIGFQQEVGVLAHRLPGDAGVVREFRLGYLPTRGERENGIDEYRNALVLKGPEDAARVL